MKKTDVRIVSARWYGLPVFTRVPLKFGSGVVTEVVCARGCIEVETADGRRVEGWGAIHGALSVPDGGDGSVLQQTD